MDFDGEDAEDLFAEPEESTENNNAENEKSAENSAGVRVSPPKRTRIVKNPRLKFDPERLCGKRGIPVLVDHFKNTKFSGKGHEKEDLDKLMAGLEHWTHRLFPSMKFEECLQQIERLGKKRPVQTCLMKIRMDMPVLSSDFLKEKEEDHVMRNEDLDSRLEEVDPFDQLILEKQDAWEPSSQVSSSFVSKQSDLVNAISSNGGQVLGSKMPSKITDEQKQIMERNRLLAIERRKAKMAAEATSKSNSQDAQERPASVSFDSLLSSSPGNACPTLEETAILRTSFKDAENPDVGVRNSPVLGIDDFKDGNEEMDACAFMDSTIEIAVNPLPDNSSNKVDDVIEDVPAKCQNSELGDSVLLGKECTPGVSERRLEDHVEIETIDLDAKKANFVEGPKDKDMSPQNIPVEYLGLESLMDLVDED